MEIVPAFRVEGVVVLTCSQQRHHRLYKTAAALVSGIAFLLGGYRIVEYPGQTLQIGGMLTLLLLCNARWSKWLNQSNGKAAKHEEFIPLAGYFVALALVLGIQIINARTPAQLCLPAFALTGVFFAYALPLHGLIELAFLGQFYLLGAVIFWLIGKPAAPLPYWNPALMVAATLAIVHWWQGQRPLVVRMGLAGQTLGAIALVALLEVSLGQRFSSGLLLLILPALAVFLTGYGTATRAIPLAIAGQFFVLVGIARFLELLLVGYHPWNVTALLAVAGVTANGMAVERAFRNVIGSNGLPLLESRRLPILEIYRLVALGMYVAWGFAYVRESWLFAFLSFSALALFGSGAWSKLPCRIRRSGLLLLVALGTFWGGTGGQVSWPNAIAVMALLITYHAARRGARGGKGLTNPWAIRIAYPMLATLWLLVSRWMRTEHHGYMSAAWFILAIMAIGVGFVLRERCHRRAGVLLLGIALGRFVVIDMWQLEMTSRIVSLLVFGIVLSLLFSVYNRFADRIQTLE